MNALTNQVNLIGFLGSDPEVKTFEKTQKATFSIATNQSFKNESGEWVTDTQWHNIVCWGKTCDVIQKLFKKGTHVALSGKLTYNSYEDKEGRKRNTTEVVLKDFVKLNKDN